jgi:hypothetical protein
MMPARTGVGPELQLPGFGWIGDKSVLSNRFQSFCAIVSTGGGVGVGWVVVTFGDVTQAESARPRAKLEGTRRI